MKSYRRYIQRLQDFEFRIINPLAAGTASNDNYRFGDVEELNSLKKFIIEEFETLTPGNARLKLKKLREINSLFIYFDKNYPSLYERSENGLLRFRELKKYFPLLSDTGLPKTNLTPDFLKRLYQSILFRQKSLLDLINKTEDLMAGAKG